ncbi:hypothetical protein MACH17_43830 [Phaeobacter inhibens]|nr:hypothetical protein MACH17_43830 [Phaeobacter inhibens]
MSKGCQTGRLRSNRHHRRFIRASRHQRRRDCPESEWSDGWQANGSCGHIEAIISNGDNLTYGNIVSVYASADETVSALTDEGITELKDMIGDARATTKT